MPPTWSVRDHAGNSPKLDFVRFSSGQCPNDFGVCDCVEGLVEREHEAAHVTDIFPSSFPGPVKDKALEILSETALWYRPGTPPKAIRWVLVRDPAGQQDPQAFFSTDPNMDPTEIIGIFVRRWQVEVTFQEVRAHLGVETQRQWSDDAIERTTPVLLGLYSLVCLWAGEILAWTPPHPYRAAWYWKSSFTFSDAIAAVRAQLWLDCILQRSASDRKRQKILPFNRDQNDSDSSIPEYTVKDVPPERIQRMVEALCFAA